MFKNAIPRAGLLTLAGVLLWIVSPTQAITPQQVRESIERGKQWLYTQRNPDGHWEVAPKVTLQNMPESRNEIGQGGQWGGPTAMVVYALLAGGEREDDPRLRPAIDFMLAAEIDGVYALSMRLLACAQLRPTPEIQRRMRTDAQILLRSMKTHGHAAGHWDYLARETRADYSHSRSQYGALGLWIAAEHGVEVPQRAWQLIEQGWVRNQDPSGGWGYTHPRDNPELPLTPGMTAAGIATLYVTNDHLYAQRGVDCRGMTENPAIEAGMRWLADHMHLVATDTPYDRDFPYATVFAVERIGLASGLKRIGEVDWFEKGAEWLIRNQNPDGSWPAQSPKLTSLVNSSFAVLFLSRGRAPVLFNKLQYSTLDRRENPIPANWNLRPRDVPNLARWVGRRVERELNFQIVSIDSPVEQWHDAPVLYISGNEPLRLTQPQAEKLRQFVEQGGLIFGHADCRNQAFARSFTTLGKQLFPEYEFRELPDNHPIYHQMFTRDNWNRKPSLQGLSNGVRELMLLNSRDDLARDWQTRNTRSTENWELAANVFLYSIEATAYRYKGESPLVVPDPQITP